MKPGTPALRSTRLLDQVWERIRYLHYSLSTEKAYLHWVRFLIRWHGRSGVMQHPRGIGAREVDAFLTMLATECRVSASTHNQALGAILFLYRELLGSLAFEPICSGGILPAPVRSHGQTQSGDGCCPQVGLTDLRHAHSRAGLLRRALLTQRVLHNLARKAKAMGMQLVPSDNPA